MKGKVVAITGAARGIGKACAQRFIEEGARVAVLDRDQAEASEVAERLGALAIAVDVSDQDGVDDAIARVVKALGGIDVMVNNAGIALDPVPLWETSPEHFRQHLDVNTLGVLNGMRAAARHMKPGSGGAIVNTASVLGIMALPGYSSYLASKFAVVGLTKLGSVELGPRGIRVNAVCPTTVRTPMLDEFLAGAQEAAVLSRSSQLGAILEAPQVASVVAFLASHDASGITGQALAIDCGISAGVSEQAWSILGS